MTNATAVDRVRKAIVDHQYPAWTTRGAIKCRCHWRHPGPEHDAIQAHQIHMAEQILAAAEESA